MMTDLLTEYAKTFGYTFRLQDYDVSSISALTQKLCHVVKVSRSLFLWMKMWQRQHLPRDAYLRLAFPCSPLALVPSSQEVSALCAVNALLGSRRGLSFEEFWSCSSVLLRGLAEVMSL